MPGTTRSPLESYLLKIRYPLFDNIFCNALDKIIISHLPKPDISDEVVDDVRKSFRKWNEDLWVIESDRINAELQIGPEGEYFDELYDRERWRRFIDDAQTYRHELMDLPPEELKVKYWIARQQIEYEEEKAANEKQLWEPFRSPISAKDFYEWLSLPTWSIEESIALSLNSNPLHATKQRILQLSNGTQSTFVRRFNQYTDHIQRAIEAEFIQTPIRPLNFICWCLDSGLNFPVEKLPVNFLRRPKGLETYDSLLLAFECLQQEINELKQIPVSDSPKTSDTKKRNTDLKLILAMACRRYGYRTDKNNSAATKISSDSELYGEGLLRVSDDTVRERLVEAKLTLNFSSRT